MRATQGISDTQKKRNRSIATPRARVEHVFGALAQMGGQAAALHGHRPRHLQLAPQGGELQLEKAGVPEGGWTSIVLNDYNLLNRRQIARPFVPGFAETSLH